jgi:hypothetical protein
MTPSRTISFFNALLLLAPIASALAGNVGNCHPYPGAAAQDCLELIGQSLRSEVQTNCTDRRATITLRNCSITTKCGPDVTAVLNDDAVRRALTAIGSCALSDYGSISGYYIADDGSKTCYLYPGQ